MFNDYFKNAEKKREKKYIELIEHEIYKIDKIIKNELEKGINLENIEIEDLTKQNLANLVFYIISKDKIFVKIYINVVKYFLIKYTKYSSFEGNKELFLRQLSMSMHPEKFAKDVIIIHKGDIGDKFYIILKGSVSIIIVQEKYEYLTQSEYDKYLEKLLLFKEYSLIKLVFTYPNPIKGDQNILEIIHEELSAQSEKQNNNNYNNYEKISAIEYVERIKPEINNNDIDERIKVKIAIYKIVANLKEGDTFGEIALNKIDKEERKRTATVISDTDCIMGTILNQVYSSFLKEIEEKNKLFLIGHVLHHTLFRDVTVENFLKYNYFNYFNSVIYKGGDFLFKQGDIRNAIYFINDGLINLYTESSFEEIDNYIEYFQKEINKYYKKYNLNNKKESDDYYINRQFHIQREINPGFNKYYKTKKKFKIYNINEKETLGYGDFLLGEEYFVSAKVISANCKVFVLEKNFLLSLLKDHLISNNYSLTNIERMEIMYQRLRNIKSIFLRKYLDNNKKTNSNLNNKIPKIEKETINNFKHSNTKLYLKQNINKKEFRIKYEILNDKYIFSQKIKRKMASKKYNILSNSSFKSKNYSIKEKALSNKKRNYSNFIFQKEETEKNKETILKNQTQSKIINLKTNISYNPNYKNEDKAFPVLSNNKSLNNKRCKTNDYDCEKKISSAKKFNSLIPKISSLSNKYMINEYGNNKNKIKKRKNMTQLDFLFYDYFFTERGNKNYSKGPFSPD